MSSLSHIDAFNQLFSEKFPNIKLEIESPKLGEGSIYYFKIDVSSEKELEENWQKIGNVIALNFQNKLESEFEIWNIYLFFIIPSEIRKDLKYKIENDTFSSRKIIVIGNKPSENILEEFVINKNFSVSKETSRVERSAEPFIKNEIISDALKGRTVIKTNRNIEEANIALESIRRALKGYE